MSVRAAFSAQAKVCPGLGSPFMGRLMALFANRLERGSSVADRILDWPGDVGPSAQSVPLRTAGALHSLILRGKAPGLAAVYPPHETSDDALWDAVMAALGTHSEAIHTSLDSPPQTNEVRRAACLIATGHALTARFGLPLQLSELGASAGVNLLWDHFALEALGTRLGPAEAPIMLTPDWTGPPPISASPNVIERRGVDLRPVDLTSEDAGLRLLSYLWPDQPDRLARTRAAMALPAPQVDKGDAIDWLATRLEHPHEGTLHLVFHTIAWQYFPAEVQARGERLLSEAGTRATQDRPLARLSMEPDGQSPGAALHLTTWPGGRRQSLGRIDFHGRWLNWTSPDWTPPDW
ncbi:DUF2332 domain-containing protein [Pseudaestuariivita sp.]|uniref:DUF2332 domain-containing protein n=1 Tax=Pseudaestuariivita sp. TaxID=2211669 RepID=UPI004059BFA5